MHESIELKQYINSSVYKSRVSSIHQLNSYNGEKFLFHLLNATQINWASVNEFRIIKAQRIADDGAYLRV